MNHYTDEARAGGLITWKHFSFVIVLFIVISIGSYIMWTMKDEIENHPEITEIGAPPRLDIMVVTVLVLAGAVSLILKFGKKKEDDEK